MNKELRPIQTPELSDWECHLFGSYPNNGIIWRPLKGKHPNCFWRKMQWLLVGNRWVNRAATPQSDGAASPRIG